MDKDVRWGVVCYAASSALWLASAAMIGSSSPALAGVFLSVSGLNLLCAGKEYKKFKNNGKMQTVNVSEKSQNTNQKSNTRERTLTNEDKGILISYHLSKIKSMLAGNIDKTFGTHLKDKKPAKSAQTQESSSQIVEKMISNKKVKE